jgi:RNA polymerase sigma-70 factor (ECF subfamily)
LGKRFARILLSGKIDNSIMDDPENNQEEQLAEVDLIRRIGDGDRASFHEFYEKYSGLVVGTAFRVLNDPRDAEDVAQEVFVMIWEKARLYDPSRGKPLTWVVTMTRNKAIDRLRSLQRRFRLRDELEAETNPADFIADRAPADDLEASERESLLRTAVDKLARDQREAIEMAYFGGMTQQEIAERLGEPLGTVKARIRRGLLRLRRLAAGARP